MPIVTCRECENEVSTNALTCPSCGAPYPWKETFDGYGWEWKSQAVWLGIPLVHISFKYRQNRMPVIARGWLAIGQFSYGFINISQFGVGPFALSQFSLAGMAISQITAAILALCQIGLVYDGWGQIVFRLKDLL
jgi:hypothetical protein